MGITEAVGFVGSLTTMFSFLSGKLTVKPFNEQLKKIITAVCNKARESFADSPEFQHIIPEDADRVIYDAVIHAIENKKLWDAKTIQARLAITNNTIFDDFMSLVETNLLSSFEYCQKNYQAWSRQNTSEILSNTKLIANKLDDMQKTLNELSVNINEKNSSDKPTVMLSLKTTTINDPWEQESFNNQIGLEHAITGRRLLPSSVNSCPRLPQLEIAKDKLEDAHYVIINGEPGCGKSITAYQLAYDYHKMDWSVFSLAKENAENSNLTIAENKAIFIRPVLKP